jgi:hypothetical protein
MEALLDAVLDVPHAYGVTRCHVVASARGAGRQTIVRVSELADNPGPSISLAFDAITHLVRDLLRLEEEPLWVEHWPSRAIASLLLHDEAMMSHHLRLLGPAGWIRCPLDQASMRLLMDC